MTESIFVAAGKWAVTQTLRQIGSRIKDPFGKSLAQVFLNACRATDAHLCSGLGDSLSSNLGDRDQLSRFAEILVFAELTGQTLDLVRRLEAARDETVPVDVDLFSYFFMLAREVNAGVRESIAGSGSPLESWYSLLSQDAMRELLRMSEWALQTTAPSPGSLDHQRDGSQDLSPSVLQLHVEPNERAVGQQDGIESLKEAFRSHRLIALHGLGGVGKSQLASRFAVEAQDALSIVFGFPAGSSVEIDAAYSRLGKRLGITRSDSDAPTIVNSIRQHLRERTDWLLVFDGAPDRATVAGYVSYPVTGMIIITSTNGDWRPLAEPVPVDPLPPTKAAAYLLDRSGSGDLATATSISERLGGLPLAIEQAGAFCAASGATLREYESLLGASLAGTLESGPTPEDHPSSVVATLTVATSGAQAQHNASRELLEMCSTLAHEPVPISLLRDLDKDLPESLSTALSEATSAHLLFGALRRFSLVERLGDDLVMHRLVQEITWSKLAPQLARSWVDRLTTGFRRVLPSQAADPVNRSAYESLVGHALKVCRRAEKLHLATQDLAWVIDRVATYRQAQARFREAIELFEWAVRVSCEVLGPDHPDTSSYRSNLGLCLCHVDAKDAAALLHEVVEGYQSLPSEQLLRSSGYATALQNLGFVELSLDRLDEAESHFLSALAVYGRTIPEREWEQHTEIAHLLNNMGLVYRKQGRTAHSLQIFERVLTFHRAKFGPWHPGVATAFLNMGLVMSELGQLDSALELLSKAVDIRWQLVGQDHPLTASALAERGNLFRQLAARRDDSSLRDRMFHDLNLARGIFERQEPVLSSDIGYIENLLAIAYLDTGDLSRARSGFECVLDRRIEIYGRSHTSVAQALTNLGRVQVRLGYLDAAETSFRAALEIARGLGLGEAAPSALAIDGLGDVAERRGGGYLAVALKQFRRAYEILFCVYGESSHWTINEADKVERVRRRLGSP